MRNQHRSALRPASWLGATVISLGLIVAGCGDTKKSTATTDPTTSVKGDAVDYSTLTATINGSGSSFQDTLQQTVKGEFAKVATNATVNYAKSGSSAGKTDLQSKTVQFAGTDSLIKAEDKSKFTGGDVLYFPIAAAPITVSYNAPGADGLKLTADVIAGIFQGEITTWTDPKIAADNAGVKLPDKPIVVVRRSDGSGTTSNFTKFLKKAAPTVWKLDSGDTVNWPTSTQGAEKNSGVAKIVKDTVGAVGYVDLSDSVSAGLQRALVKNADGKFVEAKLPGASAALAGTTVKDDLTFDPINAAGAESYPITAPTWMIVYAKQDDAKVADTLKGYLNFMLMQGEELANGVGYAKLPAELNAKAIEQISRITS